MSVEEGESDHESAAAASLSVSLSDLLMESIGNTTVCGTPVGDVVVGIVVGVVVAVTVGATIAATVDAVVMDVKVGSMPPFVAEENAQDKEEAAFSPLLDFFPAGVLSVLLFAIRLREAIPAPTRN